MKHAQFDYVNQFHCLAGHCPDTCCKDWQILLDPDAIARYRAMSGALGERVRAALVTEDGQTRFREQDGKCVLLQPDGLCPIQAAYGAEALCRTCFMHPRFIEEYGQNAELTLSCSCPEAARLCYLLLLLVRCSEYCLMEEILLSDSDIKAFSFSSNSWSAVLGAAF